MRRLRSLSGPEWTRFLKFSVVGAVGFVIDIAIFNLLHGRFGWPDIPAESVSFLAAVTSNFIWNRYWTYPDSRSKPLRRQALQFGLVSGMGLVIRTIAFSFLIGPCTRVAAAILRIPATAGLGVSASSLGANLTLGLVILIVLFWNFFANRYWTYSDVDSPQSAAGESRQLESPPV